MFSRATKLRIRRSFRMRRKQFTSLGDQTEYQFDKFFFRRLERLLPVRRFVAAWIALLTISIIAVGSQMFMLSSYYQQLRPASGGTYVEGTVGDFSNANPLYATTLADKTVSKLVFAGLLKYDSKNELVGDLARSWKVDDRGEVYTVTLRERIFWHDGKPVTSDDVMFTYQMIQHADAASPLQPSWQGVEVQVVDKKTIQFKLANPLVSFEHSLTNGIIPKHILKDVPIADLRSVPFNAANPIGSGPFKWKDVEVVGTTPQNREIRVALTKFAEYHLGEPKLDSFTVRVFSDVDKLQDSFNKKELTAITGLRTIPNSLQGSPEFHYFPQTAAMMTFFKTSEGVLKDKAVRQALVQSIDTTRVKETLKYSATRVDAPILRGQIGYDKAFTQLSNDQAAAERKLNEAKWTVSEDGLRIKDDVPLEFSLVAERSPEAERVTKELQRQWLDIGVKVNVMLQPTDEFRVTLSSHSYEALLRGIAIGPDPDVYVFWHSDQTNIGPGSGLNFSEYSSKTADEALEAARTRIDPKLRAEKLQPFLKAWREDAPALGLYQPSSLYVTRGNVYELRVHEVNDASDRFSNVHEWQIRREKTTVD